MFAILLKEENLPHIYETYGDLTETDKHGLETYIAKKRVVWYLIRGYVSSRGGLPHMNVMPEDRFKKTFDYDPIKIKTDWDLIVRK